MGYEAFTSAQRMAIQNGQAAREEQRQMQDRNALSTATAAYVGGDVAGARNALATNGDLTGVMALDRNTAATAATERTTRFADEDRAKATVLAGAQGLLRLPEDQWIPTFTSRVAPRLLEVGIDQPMIDQILADGISRQELEAIVTTLGGETERGQVLQGQNGQIDRLDPYTGEIQSVRPAGRGAAPAGYQWTETGGLIAIPGGPADESVVRARAAAGRAPPRARGGGRGGGGGSRSSAPAAPAGRPWERSW